MNEAIKGHLRQYPVFTVKDLAGTLDKPAEYASLQTYRWKKKNIIHEVEKGKYSFEEDPFVIASWILWPSYISGWAALQYYHLTEQLPFTIQVMTTRKRNKKSIKYGNAKIEFTTVKPSFLKGFQQILYHQKEIFIAEKEKAIVDAVATKRMSLNECTSIIQHNKNNLNLKRLFSYATMIKGLSKKIKAGIHD